MAESRHRGRTALRWLLTAAIVVYAIGDWGQAPTTETAEPSDEPAASELRILSISDAEVNRGDAVVVKFDGAEGTEPITAKIAKHPAEIVVRDASSLVVRVPQEVPYGKASMRLWQGDRRSKSWDLHVRPANHRKLIGRVLGGLAIFIFGLGLLATGMRGLAGQRLRTLLGRLTRSPPQAVGVGILVGASTQLTSSAAAFAVGLVDARLLALAPTVAILVGAQLGASIIGAVLPVTLAHESLLVIAVGVLWLQLSNSRRSHAVAQLVLGAGMMLYGLHLLQTSVEPLVSDPKLLPYLDRLREDGVIGYLRCAGVGAVLALLLQGPGPVYVLVVGLAQASSALSLGNALAILAGASFGAALGMALIAWQSGRTTRVLALPQLAFGAFATVAVLATLPVWSALADAVVGMPGGVSEYQHTSAMAIRLAIGFASSQLAVVLVWLALLPSITARLTRRRELARMTPLPTSADTVVLGTQRVLASGIERLRDATAIALETACTSDRARTAALEEALGDARRTMEGQYNALGVVEAGPGTEDAIHAAVACLQLQRVVEHLVYAAELGVERGLRLTPEEQTRLRAMHEIARQSFDAVLASLRDDTPPDIEAAGAREIQMNQLEVAGRSTAITGRRTSESSSIKLGLAELADSYEHIGNHLFRVLKTLAGDHDDLV